MRVAIIYNKDLSSVINTFGMQNKETYDSETVKRVAVSLEKNGHNVEIIDGNMNVIESIMEFLPKVQEGEKFGLVFNMAYGIQGESRYTHIPAMLEMLGIPYVGSSPAGHAVALDKVITKIILQKNNIPTPDFWVFSSGAEDMSAVEYPVIVKPKMESVSFGLRVVYNPEDLKEAVDYVVDEFKQQALVEKFIRGREFTVGLLGNDPVEVFPVLEIDLGGDPDAIQTFEDKKYKPKNKLCPAPISEEMAEKMKELSLKAFESLGLRDFSRVDIRVDKDDNIYILEINSMASLRKTGSYVAAAQAHGYDYSELVNKMLDAAAIRYFTNAYTSNYADAGRDNLQLSFKLRSYIRDSHENTKNFLEEIVNIDTHVNNIEGVNKLGSIIKKRLTALGFSYEIFPQSEVGDILFFTNSGNEAHDYLIVGNLDNVAELIHHKCFQTIESKYSGTGVWENKGGLAVMVLALQSLKYVRLLRKMRIGILLTTDDSLQGRFSKNIIHKKSSCAEYIIGLHGAFSDGGMVTSRSGAAFYNFKMNLKKPTSNFDVPMAGLVFSKLLADWVRLSDEESGIIVSPKKARLDSKISEPYVHGEALLSVRFNESAQFQDIDSKLRKAMPYGKYKNKIEFQLEGGLRRPAMINNSQVQDMFERIKQIAKNLDIPMKGEHRWSSADICLADANKARIDGFGPNGTKDTNGDEYIFKHALTEKALILAMLLHDLNSRRQLPEA